MFLPTVVVTTWPMYVHASVCLSVCLCVMMYFVAKRLNKLSRPRLYVSVIAEVTTYRFQ